MPRKPPPESSVPGKNLPRGSRRNQLRRGHGSPPVLGEVPYELSTVAHSKECKRSPQQFIPAGFPLHNQLPTGTEDSAIPLTTPDMVRSGRVLQTSVKSPFKVGDNQRPERTGEVGGINCGGDMGVPPVLSEVPHELSTASHSKECKRSPQQFVPAGFPLSTTNFPRDGRLSHPLSPHRTRPPNLS